MELSPVNFLTHIKNLVTGGGRQKDGVTPHNDAGFKRDVNYPLSAIAADPTSIALTDNSAGAVSGTLAVVTVPDLSSWNGVTDPSATQATAITAAFTSLKNAVASIASVINTANTNASLRVSVGTNLRAVNTAAGTNTVGYTTFVVPRDYDEATDSFDLRLRADMAGATDTPKLTVTMYRLKADGSSETLATVADTVALSAVPQTREFALSSKGLKRDDVLTLKITSEAHATDAIQTFSVEPIYRSTLVSFNESDDPNGKPNKGNPLR